MKNIRLTNGTVGAIQNITFNITFNSTVEFKHILIQSSSRLGIIIGTCLHSQNGRHQLGCNRLATSASDSNIELSIWNSIQKNMITILIHILQLSALYRDTGLSNCILGMGNLTWHVHVPVKMNRFGKEFPSNTIFDICFVGRYFGVMVK